jgi:EAL domain-containing protein (putative c-di-GMP-specific phosphodiesterase class I)
MHQAVVDARRWRDAGLDFRVSVNCAPTELLGPTVLPALFKAAEAAGLPEDCVVVEVTEDSFASDPELARETLMRIREQRIGVAIDDYGTGFSSLAYLRDLPAQELKIDRSFIRTMATDLRSRVIVESTARMVKAMGLRVVAEGVEDEQTAQQLAQLGVDVLQGYLVARPMPAADVADWVKRRAEAAVAARTSVAS